MKPTRVLLITMLLTGYSEQASVYKEETHGEIAVRVARQSVRM